MNFHESENIELKAIVVDDIKKEVIAFANCDGGKLYIGIQDDGTVTGIQNTDETVLQVSNMIRDAIKPDLTMFLHYETLEVEGKHIVAIDIQRGTNRPYYIAKKGLRPEGVYVRQGYSSVPATDTMIRYMIKETDGERFEKMRALNQELTFRATEKEFFVREIPFGTKQMQTLKLLNSDGIYTNLALLLSDQCMHTIKVAVFQDNDQNIFKDRHEFTGSLMQQLNDVYSYIDLRNQTRAIFDKLRRIDTRDYPEVAVREALLNVLVHRDYGFSASALISIYADRMEFVSVGGLYPGIELEDVMVGLSVCRNQSLANVFYRLELIEAYGTGIRKILKAYENSGKTPMIETTNNAFKITLPNMNYGEEFKKSNPIAGEEERVIDFVKKNGEITRINVEAQLEISASSASRLLRRVVEKGLLVQRGKGRSSKYVLPDQQSN
ncbi:MAG: AAA family ATPase [Lachnospiraceae bacterium]|nr:AAA family ATPase [Lachnospiraceae bacterium]